MVKAAIILAAGEGTRLRLSKPKPVVDVGGFRLFQLPLISLRLIGVRKFYIVTQPKAYLHIEKAMRRLKVNYEIIINTEIKRENGYSLYLGLRAAKERVLFVSMSDHVYPPELPRRLLDYWQDDFDLLVGGDRAPLLADVNEATKILVNGNGEILAISKQLKQWTHIDTGVFIINRKRILKIASGLAKSGGVFRMSQIIMEAIRKGYKLIVGDVTGIPWLDVDTPKDLDRIRRGEARILIEKILEAARVMHI